MEELRITAHNAILSYRSIFSLLSSSKYLLCQDHIDIDLARKYIRDGDNVGLEIYLDSLIEKNNIPKTVKDLRAEAKQLAIPYYAAMTKPKLIEEIRNAKRSEKTVGKMPLEQ